jgi:hypothetical protein
MDFHRGNPGERGGSDGSPSSSTSITTTTAAAAAAAEQSSSAAAAQQHHANRSVLMETLTMLGPFEIQILEMDINQFVGHVYLNSIRDMRLPDFQDAKPRGWIVFPICSLENNTKRESRLKTIAALTSLIKQTLLLQK